MFRQRSGIDLGAKHVFLVWKNNSSAIALVSAQCLQPKPKNLQWQPLVRPPTHRPRFFLFEKKEKFCVRLTDQASANKKPSQNDVSDWVLFVYTSNLLDKYIAYYMFYMAIKFVCLDCPDRPRDKLHNVLLHSIVS